MTDTTPNAAPTLADTAGPQPLDASTIDEVGGGLSCSPEDLTRLTASLKESYENLVDFTSHVIERVIGK